MESTSLPPDQLNSVGVLMRREIEARLLIPLLQSLEEQFGREGVRQVLREVILKIAHQQGIQIAQSTGSTLAHFAASLDAWQKGDAMQIEKLEQSERRFNFNVRRCRYAEMYAALGAPELGVLLSCNRDAALIEGFNPHIRLTRTQTIMEGAEYCDFRYEMEDDSDFA
ncbi:MAG: L-2-amino-thiazoline-4-carboxylic acid hydrolase [Anaerolineales bacterium]|nr:L-2-amino-thiazoline-4-carboxylic acid hydrolase [Anaerolineales bacterium]